MCTIIPSLERWEAICQPQCIEINVQIINKNISICWQYNEFLLQRERERERDIYIYIYIYIYILSQYCYVNYSISHVVWETIYFIFTLLGVQLSAGCRNDNWMITTTCIGCLLMPQVLPFLATSSLLRHRRGYMQSVHSIVVSDQRSFHLQSTPWHVGGTHLWWQRWSDEYRILSPLHRCRDTMNSHWGIKHSYVHFKTCYIYNYIYNYYIYFLT